MLLTEILDFSDKVSMRGRLAVETIKKWLDAGKPVHVAELIGKYTQIKDGELSSVEYKYNDWLFSTKHGKRWGMNSYLSDEQLDTLRLKVEERDGVKTLVVSNELG